MTKVQSVLKKHQNFSCNVMFLYLLLGLLCIYALPSTSQQCSLIIETSVTSERSGKLPDFSRQTWAETAGDIFLSRKIVNHLNSLVSRFVVAQSLKQECCTTDFSLLHKNCKPRNTNFEDVQLLNVHSVISLLISCTFQIRKLLVTRNSRQNTRCSPPRAMDGWARDYAHHSCSQYNHHVGDFHN